VDQLPAVTATNLIPYAGHKLGVRPFMRAIGFLLPALLFASSTGVSIQTRDSLSVTAHIYSSILFTATPERSPNGVLPLEYQFAESGGTPPGMIFESYPCNKSGTTACPQIASSNGVFLDGIPTAPGSYKFILTATARDGTHKQGTRTFTVVVNDNR
jgi:hypothetical protein